MSEHLEAQRVLSNQVIRINLIYTKSCAMGKSIAAIYIEFEEITNKQMIF
jgi:hypothetical protein